MGLYPSSLWAKLIFALVNYMSYTANPIPKASFTTNSCSMVLAIYYYFFFYEEFPQGMCQWHYPWGAKPECLHTPTEWASINREMPHLGVKSKTFGLTISLGTLSYCRDTLGGGLLLLVNYTHPMVLNSRPHPPPSTCNGRKFQLS